MRFATPEYFWGFVILLGLGAFFYYSAGKKKRLLSLFADQELLAGLTANFSAKNVDTK